MALGNCYYKHSLFFFLLLFNIEIIIISIFLTLEIVPTSENILLFFIGLDITLLHILSTSKLLLVYIWNLHLQFSLQHVCPIHPIEPTMTFYLFGSTVTQSLVRLLSESSRKEVFAFRGQVSGNPWFLFFNTLKHVYSIFVEKRWNANYHFIYKNSKQVPIDSCGVRLICSLY